MISGHADLLRSPVIGAGLFFRSSLIAASLR
jgi:hypothetical protein